MAIDDAEKRKNVASIINAITIPGVTPNALKDEGWRQQSGWGYSGIPAVGPTPVAEFVGGSKLSPRPYLSPENRKVN